MIILNSENAIIEILKELRKEEDTILQAIQSKPWWETIICGVIIAGLLTFLTQFIMFYLLKKKDLTLFNNNMKKEIDFKVAELYGKLNALCPEYNIGFWEYNKESVKFHFYLFLADHYQKIISKEGWDTSLSETEKNNYIETTQKSYSDDTNKHDKICDEEFKKLKNQKLKLMEILHQIHFYYKEDKNLEKMINDFQAILSHKPKFERYTEEMGNELYLNKYIDENVKPLNVKLLELSTEIFACIRNLKPKQSV